MLEHTVRLRVDPTRPSSPSVQIVEGILDAIARGALGAGEQLPTVRGLAEQVVVNPNTVAKAYRDLEALGVVEGRHGSGVFVTAAGVEIARRERRGAVKVELQRAVEAAQATGFTREEITTEVERCLAATGRARSTPRQGGRS